MCARRRSTFLSRRRNKGTKERATPLSVSPSGQPAVRASGGVRANSLHCVALTQRADLIHLNLYSSARPEGKGSRLIPFFDYPSEIRKVIYTTNTIESVNIGLRKLSRNRGSLPSDQALNKLFYLALRNISEKWTMPIRDWKAALTRFTIQFGDRISVN